MPGRMDGISSTTVTFAPRRRQTDPSSRPMMPPPITIRCPGTRGIRSAPTLESTRSSSNLRNGSADGTDPVAMMTFRAWYVGAAAVGRRDRHTIAGAEHAASPAPTSPCSS